jgi:hypothetical protein
LVCAQGFSTACPDLLSGLDSPLQTTVGRVTTGDVSRAGGKESIFETFADRGLSTSALSTFEMADTLDLEDVAAILVDEDHPRLGRAWVLVESTVLASNRACQPRIGNQQNDRLTQDAREWLPGIASLGH